MSRESPLIGLLTDFGTSDTYVAEMKAAILTVDSSLCLIDITHAIEPYVIAQGAFHLAQAASSFPSSSVFVGVVDPGVGTTRRGIALQNSQGQLFVGPDNGLFTYVCELTGCTRVAELSESRFWRSKQTSATFHGRDRFAPVAAHLAAGLARLEDVGPAIDPQTLQKLSLSLHVTTPGKLSSLPSELRVIHIDHFGNVILNVRLVEPLPSGKRVRVGKGHSVPTLEALTSATYGERGPGEVLLLTNSAGYLELAANQSSAKALLQIKPGDAITLSWEAWENCGTGPAGSSIFSVAFRSREIESCTDDGQQ